MRGELTQAFSQVWKSEKPVEKRDRGEPKVRGDDYNYRHFRPGQLLEEMGRTLARSGVRPGQAAPDFELRRAGGGWFRLRGIRGRPLLLHFVSYT